MCDFTQVIFIIVAIPDTFGINREHWSFGASVKASGAIDAHVSGAVFILCFENPAQRFNGAIRRRTGGATFSLVPPVLTNKDVFLIIGRHLIALTGFVGGVIHAAFLTSDEGGFINVFGVVIGAAAGAGQ